MGGSFDDFVQDLQEQIFQETKESYGEVVFQRWHTPLYMGAMKDPDVHAKLQGACGDSIEIFLKFEKNRVTQASFLTDGCGPSAVCGSFAAEMSIGKNPDELLEITGEAILDRLGGLPDADEHCAYLAAETVQEALNRYMIQQTKK
jgi:nitrogen fixation NifU-like protein